MPVFSFTMHRRVIHHNPQDQGIFGTIRQAIKNGNLELLAEIIRHSNTRTVLRDLIFADGENPATVLAKNWDESTNESSTRYRKIFNYFTQNLDFSFNSIYKNNTLGENFFSISHGKKNRLACALFLDSAADAENFKLRYPDTVLLNKKIDGKTLFCKVIKSRFLEELEQHDNESAVNPRNIHTISDRYAEPIRIYKNITNYINKFLTFCIQNNIDPTIKNGKNNDIVDMVNFFTKHLEKKIYEKQKIINQNYYTEKIADILCYSVLYTLNKGHQILHYYADKLELDINDPEAPNLLTNKKDFYRNVKKLYLLRTTIHSSFDYVLNNLDNTNDILGVESLSPKHKIVALAIFVAGYIPHKIDTHLLPPIWEMVHHKIRLYQFKKLYRPLDQKLTVLKKHANKIKTLKELLQLKLQKQYADIRIETNKI